MFAAPAERVFHENLLYFWQDSSQKMGIMNNCSSSRKSYISVDVSDYKFLFFREKDRMQPFNPVLIVLVMYVS